MIDVEHDEHEVFFFAEEEGVSVYAMQPDICAGMFSCYGPLLGLLDQYLLTT